MSPQHLHIPPVVGVRVLPTDSQSYKVARCDLRPGPSEGSRGTEAPRPSKKEAMNEAIDPHRGDGPTCEM
jgi:hypothetical protein